MYIRPHSHVGTLTPNVMALGGDQAYEGGALLNGINAHTKETSQGSLAPSM